MGTATRKRVFERYDAALCDLDGVVYRGDEVVHGAPEVLDELRSSGCRVVFLTNNSSMTPEEVASKLRARGVEATGDDVVSSAVATAAMLRRDGTAERLGAGRGNAGAPTAFVIGRAGIREALRDVGVRIVVGTPDQADLVVIGWDPDADYGALRTAGLLVQRGARLIGTNPDGSYPAPEGLWPGAGALLAAVVATTGATPTVVGKPATAMFEAAGEMTGARHPLVVGDRLDTDVAGAAAMGWDSMLVLTGAATRRDLLRSGPLPTYVGASILALSGGAPRVDIRPATGRAVPAAAALLRAAGLAVPGPEAGDVVVLVASADDDVVATATVFRTGHAAVLRAVAVREDVRGTGVGTLLVASAVRTATEGGNVTVFAFTETAERFLSSLGFRAIERDSVPEPIRRSPHATGECSAAVAMAFRSG